MVSSPVDIFNILSKNFEEINKFKKGLWPAEEECLNLYYNEFKNKSKIGIKLPTGAGKTLIGLLILKAWLDDGKVVAIITWTNTLAQRIEQECRELKINSVRIWGKYSNIPDPQRERKKFLYSDGEAIGIFTYATYLESDIGTIPDVLIIDDADLFIDQFIHYFQFSFRRDEFEDIYNDILNKFDEAYYPNVSSFKIQKNQFNTSVELIHFIHAKPLIRRIKDYFSPIIQSLNKFHPTRIGYEKNESRLDLFLMFISNHDITLQPFIFFLNNFNRIISVNQIILMSATLYSLGILQKNFGNYIDDFYIITENDLQNQPNTMGKRIIFPIDECDIMRNTGNGLKAIQEIVNQFNRILILSYSKPQALTILNFLQGKGVKAILYKNLDEENIFKEDHSVNCLIVANRYNGLDFTSRICNTCIITNLPQIVTSQDSFYLNVLKDVNEVQERTANRIIQGVGRCNRELNDQSIYFILDDTMKAEMTQRKLLRFFPKQIISELRLGFMESDYGRLQDAIMTGKKFLDNKYDNFDLEIEKQLETAEKYEPIKVDPQYRLEIEAWQYLINNSLEYAAKDFEKLASKYESTINGLVKRAWCYYLAAFCYYKLFDSTKDEKHYELFDEKLRICSNCNAHPVFNKVYNVKIQKEIFIEEEITEGDINLLKDWVKNPDLLFEMSWKSPEIQKFKSPIISGLKTLANGEYESAARTFPVDMEKILNELVENYGDKSKLREKPTYNDYINNLWGRRAIRKHLYERGTKGDFSITNMRNLILHGKVSVENLTKAVKYILNFITFIDELIYDTKIFRVLSNELMNIEFIPDLEEIRVLKSLDTERKVNRVIIWWAEEVENTLIFKEAQETIKDINHFRIVLKINKPPDKTEININI